MTIKATVESMLPLVNSLPGMKMAAEAGLDGFADSSSETLIAERLNKWRSLLEELQAKVTALRAMAAERDKLLAQIANEKRRRSDILQAQHAIRVVAENRRPETVVTQAAPVKAANDLDYLLGG